MKFLSVFFYDGKKDVKVYLECLLSQMKHCDDYSIIVNEEARTLLSPYGFNCIDFRDILPEVEGRDLTSEILSIASKGKYAAVSDILRIFACKKYRECCYLDGDIYLKCSISRLESFISEGEVLVGAENGGYVCTGFLMNKNSKVLDDAQNEILSSKRMSTRWQMYCGILFGNLIKKHKEAKVLNPAILMGVYYKNFKKFLKNGELLDMEKYWECNPRALGLHVCGASMNIAQIPLKNFHTTLYSSKYYREEFPEDDVLTYNGSNLSIPNVLGPTPRFLYKEGMK